MLYSARLDNKDLSVSKDIKITRIERHLKTDRLEGLRDIKRTKSNQNKLTISDSNNYPYLTFNPYYYHTN